MKALVKYEMKPHALEIRDIPIPEPGPGQIRVKVEYAGICGSDLHIYHNSIAITTRPPVVVGHEFSGFVDKVGSGVQGWKEGDRIVYEGNTYVVSGMTRPWVSATGALDNKQATIERWEG